VEFQYWLGPYYTHIREQRALSTQSCKLYAHKLLAIHCLNFMTTFRQGQTIPYAYEYAHDRLVVELHGSIRINLVTIAWLRIAHCYILYVFTMPMQLLNCKRTFIYFRRGSTDYLAMSGW